MKLSITPKKSLGQNFLVNPRILDKIVAAAEITKEDIVLEVGPGTGNLTKKLAEKAEKVIAIEKDRRLVPILNQQLSANSNVEIINEDILKFNPIGSKLLAGGYKIVANIPYYITSRFLRKIFTEWPKPKLVVLTIQKEVAQRIIARPPKMSLLAVSVQLFAELKIVGYISKENFRPRPKVDSTIIKLAPKEKLPTDNHEKFFKIIRAGFSQKRKLLISNLEKLAVNKNKLAEIFKKTEINPKSRAENLSIENWIKLTKILII
ncbi:MAG: 16S rRNA (adenine(1518)-N(6)/adenine(1519)-N(6))-dimethyltransferase RsmA [Patescibacteria group bacterium]